MIYLAFQLFCFLFLVSVAIALWPLIALMIILCIPFIAYAAGGWPAVVVLFFAAITLVSVNERREKKENEARALANKDYPSYLD